jgi:type II secretory pathway component PulM
MRLNRREKRVILLGGIFLTVVFLTQFLILPAIDRMKTLNRIIPQKEKELERIKELAHAYKIHKARPGFEDPDLSSLLNNLITATGNKEKLSHIEHRGSKIELKLKGIGLDELVELLYEIENHKVPLRIGRFHLKASGKNPRLLDAAIEVMTP